jgi:hypothetical protein
MASIINAATSGGLVTSADTSGILQLQTASTTAVTVDASQNVGIGTASPAYKLDLYTTAQFSGRWGNATRAGYFYADSGGPGIFNTAAYGSEGMYLHAGSNYIQFVTNSNENMRLDSAGGLKTKNTIGVGDAAPSTSGAGITFPATQSASSNANTLDDYEEGNWTASFVPNTSGTITLANETGTYTKVGRTVTLTGLFSVSSVSSPTGYLRITGIPFAGGSAAKNRCAVSINGGNMNATMTTVLVARIEGDSNIYVFKTDGAGNLALTTAADMKAGTEIFINVTYVID